MPVRNEGAYIARSLRAVLNQDYPQSLIEVIVADGMSTDHTTEIVKSFQQRYRNVDLLANPGRIVPTGMNLAIERARGEVIVRVDGHCEIAPDYISRCIEHLRQREVDGVGGPLETIGETFTAKGIAVAMGSKFGVGGSAFRTVSDRTMLTDSVAFPAYTRSAIDRIGRYDEELVRNQDDEYNYRLRKLGGRVLLAADVKCRYYSRGSLRSLWRQYFQYGYWKVRVLQKHPRQMQARQFVPAIFISTLFSLLMSALVFPKAGWILLATGIAYVVANVCASILTAGLANVRMLLLLPAVFFVLHFAYGSGFLFGLIRFWNRWRGNESRLQRWDVIERQA